MGMFDIDRDERMSRVAIRARLRALSDLRRQQRRDGKLAAALS